MLKILAGFLLGVPVGMIVMAILTMGKTSDLYSTIEACDIQISRLEDKLKRKEMFRARGGAK